MYTDDTSISTSSENPLHLLEDLKWELERIKDRGREPFRSREPLKLHTPKCNSMRAM